MTRVLLDAWTIHDIDPHIFDDLVLPVGMDKNIVTETIMRETMGLNVIVNEPVRLRRLIKSWSEQRLYVWNRLFNTMKLKYNPIENYNRIEEHVDRNDSISSTGERGAYEKSGDNSNEYNGTDSRNGESNANGDGTSTRTPNLTTTNDTEGETTKNDTTKGSTATNTDTTGTHNVWGFNQSEKAPSFEDITNVDETGTSETTSTSHGNDSSNSTIKNTGNEKTQTVYDENGTFSENGAAHNNQNGDFTENGRDSRNARNDSSNFSAGKIYAHGNIGVLSTQNMIVQERNISEFDIYEYISNDFKREFCIMVY